MSWIDSDFPQKQCCECFYWYPADRIHWAVQKEGRYGLASRGKLCTVINSRLRGTIPSRQKGHPANAATGSRRPWAPKEKDSVATMTTILALSVRGCAPPAKTVTEDLSCAKVSVLPLSGQHWDAAQGNTVP